MNKPPLVVIDADAIVAQAFPKDANFEKANKISQYLTAINANMLYPVTAITEAVTVLQRKLNSSVTALETAAVFTDQSLQIIDINNKIYSRAVNHYFLPSTSKKNTLFDCIAAAVAEEFKADAIFSFDNFYKKKGFKLAGEL
ncbi:PIN domain-containing protein [Candidatus Gottesmanbacteria bacterium]|nr:PIN domain-containing protein [Candidatus Gottesmanbacteria bacterium]